MKPRPVRESTIEAGVVRFCRSQDLYCRKLSSPGSSGVPDRLICGKGRVLFLELKAPGQKPTSLQLYEIDQLIKAGMTATWAGSLQGAIEVIADHFA